jgi:hypothetical protein
MTLVGEDLDAQHGVGLARSRITFGRAIVAPSPHRGGRHHRSHHRHH